MGASHPGTGSAVRTRPDARDPERNVPTVPMRVLVVDDNRDAADSLALIFELGGAVVRVCYFGDEGLRAFDEFRPHVGVFDVHMPGLNGCELARHVRERAADRPVLLVALTGVGSEDAVERTAAAGFDLHVTKPGLPADLVRRALQFYRANHATER